MRRRKGLCGPLSENYLLFALPSHCQRHHQRGPWYPAEQPPLTPSLRELGSSVGTPTASVPHSQSLGWGRRACTCRQHPTWSISTAEGPSEGGSPGRLHSCPRASFLDGLKDVESSSEAWESGRDPEVSTSRVSWALFQDPRVFEGPRSLQGRPGMTEPHAVAPPPRSGSKSVAEFPHRGRAPSSGSPGTGKRGQAAGWGRRARGCPGAADASAQASAAGTWPATAQPRGGPREPGWGCILGPLAQRSRRLRGTDSSHFGLTPQRSHKQDWPPTRASSRLPRTASHASPPSTRETRHTPTAQCHTIGAHGNPSHEP